MSKKMHRSSIITAGLTVLLLSFIIIPLSLPATSDGGVDFHADVTSGNAPLTVQFTDDTAGSQSSWTWNFGDGGSTAKNPSHTYNNPGIYDVSFTAYSLINGSPTPLGTKVKVGYIKVSSAKPSAPTADFTASPTSGTAPLLVKFKGLSSGGTLSYDWDFGDGTQHSAEMNPKHNYTAAGNYTVKLKVSNPGGSNTKSVKIVVAAPGSQITNSDNGTINGAVNGTVDGAVNGTILVVGVPVTVTPIPVSTITAGASQSDRFLNLPISVDMIEILLTALIAIVIAFAIIYFFSRMSRRDEKKRENKPEKKAPAGRNMLKSRMPAIEQKAMDDTATIPEVVKHPAAAKVPEMPMMPVDAVRQQDVVSVPAPVKPRVAVAPEVKRPRDIEILPEGIMAPVKPARTQVPVKPPVVAEAPEAKKVPEPTSPYARPVAKPPVAAKPHYPPPAAEPVRPPVEKPVMAKPPEPKQQPSKLSDLVMSKATEESKTPPPAAKPVKPARRRNEVDKDYLYGLVMGENQEQDDKK